ncbi:MAG: cupin domain-containing protein [Methylococcaceae bacterium]
MKLLASVLTTGLASATLWINSAVLADEVKMPPRQILLEKATELPANQITARVIRVVFPQGYKTPLHTHEGPGPRYVLRGRIKVEESGQVQEYGPGEVFWETGQWMTVENISEGEAEMVIFELGNAK